MALPMLPRPTKPSRIARSSVTLTDRTARSSRFDQVFLLELIGRTRLLTPAFEALGAFRRIAPDLLLEVGEVDKLIGLTAKLATNPPMVADERAEIAVAGEQHDMVEIVRQLHRVDGELDV